MPTRFETATGNPRLNGVVVDADERPGRPPRSSALELLGDADLDATSDRRHRPSTSRRVHERRPSTCRSKSPSRAARPATRHRNAGPARADRQRADGGIRELLEARFPEVWVEGELSNCRVWNTGHLYFTLKDAGAQIKARDVRARRAARCKFKPEDGLQRAWRAGA